jgi:glycosyltransferase involved in cell wall biosynthesis
MGLPYTITLRGKLYPCLENESQRGQCADALRNAAAVISVSRPMLEEAAKLGVAAEKLHLIPNGVDLDMFQPRDRAGAREALGLPADGRILVTVAHLGLRKGSRETIRAMSALPNDVHLVLVGQDSRGGKDTSEIRTLAQQLGVGGRVIVAGRQPYEKIAQYYAAADVGVLASYREGCPNAVLECLACGRPVVASRVGAVPDLVRDGVDGRVVEPRDDQALASALADVLDRHWDPAVVSGGPAVRSWDAVGAEVLRVFSQSGIGTSEE